MIEHHYTIIYNSTTGRWYWDEDDYYTTSKEGSCYDTSTGKFFSPDPDNPEMDEIVAADLDGYSKVNEFLQAIDYAAYMKELDNESSSTQGF